MYPTYPQFVGVLMLSRALLVSVLVGTLLVVACGGDDDEGDGDDGDVNPSVATATAIASAPTATLESEDPITPEPRSTLAPATPGAPLDEERAAAILEYVLLQPGDITDAGWIIQSDTTTDNEAAAAAAPEQAPSIERCGRLLSRIITNFPPDVTGNYIGGLTVSYFSTATVFTTAEGAADCSAETATRLAQPCELARSFGGVFKDPCAVVITPVEFPAVADGVTAFTLAGKSDAGGLEIDLTILAVAFNSENITAVVGSAAASTPSSDELSPYVELVADRIAESQ